MKSTIGLTLAAVAALGFSACGSSKQDAKNVTNDKVHELKLMDRYVGECENLPLDGLDLSARKVEYVISGHIDKIVTYYSSDDCEGKVLTITTTGKYENVDTLAENADTGRIDITFTHTEIEPHTEDIRNAMNEVGYCGISGWEMKSKDVSNSSDDLNCPGTKDLGDTSYDIISTRNGELRLGLAIPLVQDKTSPEKRPKALDPRILGRK